MSAGNCSLFGRDPCTACDPRAPSVPLSLYNDPGQPRLRYRVGDFNAFRQAMLDWLNARPVESRDPASAALVRKLTSRASEDYAIAVLEMWAYVLDVLTLYQEAYANEAFLRTATLRESLARLCELIGYEPGRGAAAQVYLTFTADRDATVTVPAGAKVQAIPKPDEPPAIFETSSEAVARYGSNSLVLFGPSSLAVFTNRGEMLSDAGGPAVVAGTRLLFYAAGSGPVHEQVVTQVARSSIGKTVQWRSALPGSPAVSSFQAARYGRKFKVFGANAPEKYLVPNFSASPVTFSAGTTDFSRSAGNTLALDGVFDGLAPGGRLLVVHNNGTSIQVTDAQITAVGEAPQTPRGPITGNATVVTLAETLGYCSDIRHYTVFELTGADLVFSAEQYGDTIPAETSSLRLLNAEALAAGDSLLLVAVTNSELVKVTATSAVSGGPASMRLVTLAAALKNSYTVSTTRVYANLAEATHGESTREKILGSGDASGPWQEFALPDQPLTYVPDPAGPGGVSSSLSVFVDGVAWTEVPSFYGLGPNDAVYLTRVDEKGKYYVRCGDGKTGRRFPTGTSNVRATYRKGIGTPGNVDAGKATLLLQPQPGLKSVANPVAAAGGEDPEDASGIRQNAPSTIITFERAVSLRDHEVLALRFRGVAKARAAWRSFNGRRGVALTVAGAAGKPLDQLAPALRTYLDARRDPNLPLSIREAVKIPFVLRAKIHVLATYKQADVKAAVETALGPTSEGEGYLGFNQLGFGQSIHHSALLAVMQSVAGVDWVDVEEFSVPSAYAPNRAVGPTAQRLDALILDPGEIAWASLTGDTTTSSVELKFEGGIVAGGQS